MAGQIQERTGLVWDQPEQSEELHPIDITWAILECCVGDGANMGRIVSETNMTDSKVEHYLRLLSEKGMLKKSANSYLTSEQGLGMISTMRQMAGELLPHWQQS